MRRKHVAVGRAVLQFDFTGKSGKQWKLRVEDKRTAAIVKRYAEIPGHELFNTSTTANSRAPSIPLPAILTAVIFTFKRCRSLSTAPPPHKVPRGVATDSIRGDSSGVTLWQAR